MPKRIVMLVFSIAFAAGRTLVRLAAAALGKRASTDEVVVLTYHAIADAELKRFERQMHYVATHALPVFAGVRPGDVRMAVAVTFDDAFHTVFTDVLPIALKYGVPLTVFVPTGYLGDEARWIRNQHRRRSVGPVVTADVLARLDHERVRVGSHSVTHPRLASLEGEVLDAELVHSRATLEGITGRPVRMLALPYGSGSDRVLEAARRAGYEQVFANVPIRPNESGLVGRVDVSPRDWSIEFRLKVHGAYQWMALAVPAKHRYLRLFRKPQQA